MAYNFNIAIELELTSESSSSASSPCITSPLPSRLPVDMIFVPSLDLMRSYWNATYTANMPGSPLNESSQDNSPISDLSWDDLSWDITSTSRYQSESSVDMIFSVPVDMIFSVPLDLMRFHWTSTLVIPIPASELLFDDLSLGDSDLSLGDSDLSLDNSPLNDNDNDLHLDNLSWGNTPYISMQQSSLNMIFIAPLDLMSAYWTASPSVILQGSRSLLYDSSSPQAD